MIGILICIVIAGFAYYNYQKPRSGVGSKSAEHTLTAENLYNAFATDEAAANQKYTEKVITVTGTVVDVQKSEGSVIVVLKGIENGGGVSCLFTNGAEKEWPAIGAEIEIKGRCSGYLMDVNLVDAVFKK